MNRLFSKNATAFNCCQEIVLVLCTAWPSHRAARGSARRRLDRARPDVAPQPCIGVCEDRKVRLVDAADHEATLELLHKAEERAAALEGLVRRLARTRPRAGAWEQSYKALQDEALRALTAMSLARSGRGAQPAAPREIEVEP